MKNVNIGIVGLGRLGRRHALNLLASVPGAVLVAAASPVRPATEHVHCQMSLDAGHAIPDEAPADPGAQPCDDCGGCHQAAYSLPVLPALLAVPDFSSVKLTGPTAPVSSRVPALPDRPPNTAAA